jgi:hypothetical protein
VNSVKRISLILLTAALSLLVSFSVALPLGTVSAQTSSYTIDKVDHEVVVMYSGHVVILDTIHVSGQVTDGFMIGLPRIYSNYVLKGLAYDQNNLYQMNMGVQFGNGTGFYGAEIDFNGNSPSVFTVAFVLSNGLITEESSGVGTLDFPAYPSLTQNVGTCDVTISFPSTPTSLTITKDDGETSDANYVKTNLLAYTYSQGIANFQVPVGTLQSLTITSLDRQITIDPSGLVTAIDSYRLINNFTSMNSFVIGLPLDATNVDVKDDVGRTLQTAIGTTAEGDMLLANATLVAFLTAGQSSAITVQYNLPSAKLEGSNYNLGEFALFPSFFYYVNHSTVQFIPPEGATIVTPQLADLDTSSTLTREAFQDKLTVKRDGLSFVDYSAPKDNFVEFSYSYSPVWAAFRPTFWALLLAIVGSIGAVVYRKRRPKEEEPYALGSEELPTPKPTVATPAQQKMAFEVKPGQHVTVDNLSDLVDAYETRKELTDELKTLQVRAQKGKIPRRQYKVQKRAIEIRLEGLTRSIEKTKAILKGSSSAYADLAKQLDAAEADLAEAEEDIRILESRQRKGEVSLEYYKRNIGEYKKRRDKAESGINGIMLRLREKIR